MEHIYLIIIIIETLIIIFLVNLLFKRKKTNSKDKDLKTDASDFIIKSKNKQYSANTFKKENQQPEKDSTKENNEISDSEIDDLFTETEDQDGEEPEKEYNFEDPDFNLPPIIPTKEIKGKVINKHGDAIYGNEQRYFKGLYYGRVSEGAKLELKDKRVYKNEFSTDIIKVLVITNEWQDEVGRIGWIGLQETSFRNSFNPAIRQIE